MNNKVLIGAVIATVLIIGAIFVSAQFISDEEPKLSCEAIQSAEGCTQNSCNVQCGGNCGVPSCGCGG